jgi:hypothetical protein
MMSSWLSDQVSAANTALGSMPDKGARWWNFSVSHTTFNMVVGDPLGNDNVVMSLCCGYLAGPVEWPNQRLEVQIAEQHVVIEDQSVGFRAEGGVFHWRRNFDLLSYHGIWGGRSGGPETEVPLDTLTQRFRKLLSRYYEGEIGYGEVAIQSNFLLWYDLPARRRAEHQDPRND